MQRFITLSTRIAPRSMARLPAFSSAATALPICSRMLVPSLAAGRQTPLCSRFMASEAAVQRQVEQLESQTIDPKTDLSGSKQQGTSDGAAPEYVPVPFQSYTTVHQKTKLAIERLMKFKTASKVQDQIISRLPIERDIMIKAKTGTGKTTAFLVPAIETLLREYEKDPARASNGRAVGCLIVSPTRELAKQIATEAEKLVKFHGWNVQSLVGGERSRDQLNSLARNRSDIVIGTPGRILDFMENQPMFQNLASKTKLLVFDEADVLLQMGFRREIGEIIANVPTDRQTFLVSATIDKKIKELAPEVFHRGFDLVDCVEKGETNTHHNVKQEYITVENSQHFPVLCDAMQTHISKNKAEGHGSKIIVFMPTTKSADMYAQIMRALMKKGEQTSDDRRRNSKGYGKRGFAPQQRNSRPAGERVEVFLLHGKMTQEARSRISDRFRNSPVDANTTSILITTDVSARGVDYPNVSMVMQVGIPTEAEAYIHRLGRTGRAGKSGEGVILLNSIETKFLKQLKNVPIKASEKYTPEYIESIANFEGEGLSHLASRWEAAAMYADVEKVQDTYMSLVGFYQGHTELIGNPMGQDIVDASAEILKPFDAPQPPLPRLLRESLGLDRKPRAPRGGNDRRGGFHRRGGDGFGSSRGGSRFSDRRNDRRNDRYGDRFGDRHGDQSGFGGRERTFSDRPRFDADRHSFDKSGSRKQPWQMRGSVRKSQD